MTSPQYLDRSAPPPAGGPGPQRERVHFPPPQPPRPAAKTAKKGARRAALQLKRVDPWSVLKVALVRCVALFFLWMLAVAILFFVLQGLGVWDSLNEGYKTLANPDPGTPPLISAGFVFGITAMIGGVGIVLFSVLATAKSLVYNVSADLAGGVELTLTERGE